MVAPDFVLARSRKPENAALRGENALFLASGPLRG